MAVTNQERVGKALDLLRAGLVPFVVRELKAQDAQGWLNIVRQSVSESQMRLFQSEKTVKWDAASLLSVLANQWDRSFRRILGQAERNLVFELRDVRNKWAHQNPFSGDDAERALDSMARLLTAVSATPQAEEVNRMKLELRRNPAADPHLTAWGAVHLFARALDRDGESVAADLVAGLGARAEPVLL